MRTCAGPQEAEREPPKQIKLPGGDVYAGTAVGEVPDGVGVLELASTLGRYEGEVRAHAPGLCSMRGKKVQGAACVRGSACTL